MSFWLQIQTLRSIIGKATIALTCSLLVNTMYSVVTGGMRRLADVVIQLVTEFMSCILCILMFLCNIIALKPQSYTHVDESRLMIHKIDRG